MITIHLIANSFYNYYSIYTFTHSIYSYFYIISTYIQYKCWYLPRSETKIPITIFHDSPTYDTLNLQHKFRCFIWSLKNVQFSQKKIIVWNTLQCFQSLFKIRIYIKIIFIFLLSTKIMFGKHHRHIKN